MSDLDHVLSRSTEAAAIAADTSDADRALWLEAVAAALDDHAGELVPLADDESHLGSPRLTGELARTTAQLRLFAEMLREGSYLEATLDHANAQAIPPHGDLRRLLVPLGVVAVFAASNFPFAFSVAGGDTASALAVGCSVVVKIHPGHPILSRRVAAIASRALDEAGAPTGLLSTIEGQEEGVALVEHPAVAAVGFTGSVAGGRALFDRAVARPQPIPFYGELGSVNPVVVTAAAASARAQDLASGLAGSFTLGAGQFCTKPGVVFVPDSAAAGFAELVAAALPGGGTPLLTASIREGFPRGVAALADDPGVTVVAGDPAQPTAPDGATPVLLLTDVASILERPGILLDECFGPVTLLVRYRDGAELIAGIEAVPGSLTATLHAEPGDEIAPVVAALRSKAGRLLFAGWPTGVAVTWSQQHGGPYPATTSIHTSVGTSAARRWLRPLAFQDAPASVLPAALLDGNPLGIVRRVDGVLGQR